MFLLRMAATVALYAVASASMPLLQTAAQAQTCQSDDHACRENSNRADDRCRNRCDPNDDACSSRCDDRDDAREKICHEAFLTCVHDKYDRSGEPLPPPTVDNSLEELRSKADPKLQRFGQPQ